MVGIGLKIGQQHQLLLSLFYFVRHHLHFIRIEVDQGEVWLILNNNWDRIHENSV